MVLGLQTSKILRMARWLSWTLVVACWSLLLVSFPACRSREPSRAPGTTGATKMSSRPFGSDGRAQVPGPSAKAPFPALPTPKPRLRVVAIAPEGCVVLEGGEWLCPSDSATPENGCPLERRLPPSVPRNTQAAGCAIDAQGWVNCPKATKLLPKAIAIAAGSGFWCALQQTGSIWCWGQNNEGLGDGRSHQATRPVRVRLAAPARQLAVGSGHGCALVADGSVWCWGDNTRGTLGLGEAVLPSCCELEPNPRRPNEYLTPQRVPTLGLAASIHAQGLASCALTLEGTVLCWGENDGGQLGNPRSSEPLAAPRPVSGLPPVVQLEMGYPMCALTRDRDVFCWGSECPVGSTIQEPQKIDWASLPGGP